MLCDKKIKNSQWKVICESLTIIEAKRGDTLLENSVIAESLIFVCQGVAASVQSTADGDQQIARFFEHGDMCSNTSSAWYQSVGQDELVAMTDFAGIMMPFSMFCQEFISGDLLGVYFRDKVIETLLFDKDILCAKTLRTVEARYHSLRGRHRSVVTAVPDKYIAQFLGITPQGLSRFLNKNR